MKKLPQRIRKIDFQKKILYWDGRKYRLAAITKDFTFYVDHEESDETCAVLMYNKRGELVSNNFFAANYLLELVLDTPNLFVWQSKNFKYNSELQRQSE